MLRDKIHFEKGTQNLINSVLISRDLNLPKVRPNLKYKNGEVEEVKIDVDSVPNAEQRAKILKTIEE